MPIPKLAETGGKKRRLIKTMLKMQIERKISYTPNIPSLNSKAARRTIRSLIKCAGLVAAADLPPEVFFTVTFYFKNQ
jgi:hypothetical protein